jgi:hypothetical protein
VEALISTLAVRCQVDFHPLLFVPLHFLAGRFRLDPIFNL